MWVLGKQLPPPALSSRVLEESQIEGCKHQNNADIYHQPFPESILKEQYIYANDNGHQYENVKHHIDIPWHFNHPLKYVSSRLSMKLLDFPLDPLGGPRDGHN